MQGLAIVLAAASLGVDYGWQTTDDGALEYIIQIEPELLIALQKGESIVSEIHPDAAGVRRFRIQIGSQPLPRVGKSPQPKPQAPLDAPPEGRPLLPEPPSPAEPPLPDPGSEETKLSPPGKTFVEDGPSPPFTPADPSQPNSSDFPLPNSPPAAGKSTPLPATEPPVPPTEFPIDENAFPVTPAVEAPTEIPTPPLPLPADDLSTPQTKPVRQKLVPVPDPDRQPLDPIPIEPSFPATPDPGPPSVETETNNAATVIPSFADAQLATFTKTGDKPAAPVSLPRTTDSETSSSVAVTKNRPWLLLSVTLLGLLASLGANAYLAYLFVGIQRRYQGLRQQQRFQANEAS